MIHLCSDLRRSQIKTLLLKRNLFPQRHFVMYSAFSKKYVGHMIPCDLDIILTENKYFSDSTAKL